MISFDTEKFLEHGAKSIPFDFAQFLVSDVVLAIEVLAELVVCTFLKAV